MKKISKYLLFVFVIGIILALAACNARSKPNTTETDSTPTTQDVTSDPVTSTPTTTEEKIGTLENPLSFEDIIRLGNNLPANSITNETYYVKAFVWGSPDLDDAKHYIYLDEQVIFVDGLTSTDNHSYGTSYGPDVPIEEYDYVTYLCCIKNDGNSISITDATLINREKITYKLQMFVNSPDSTKLFGYKYNELPYYGTITPSLYFGTTVTLEAIAPTGYKFVGWYGPNDALISEDDVYEFYIVKDMNIYMKWETLVPQSTYTLTTINDNNSAGTITSYTNQTFNANSSVTLEALPNSGYVFDGWYNGENIVSTDATYTFNINSNLVLTAKWNDEIIIGALYLLTTVNSNVNAGTITNYNNQLFLENESVTLVATPNDNYAFDGWYNGENRVSTSETYAFNINKDLTLTAKWTEVVTGNTYTLTTINDNPTAGTIIPFDNQEFDANTSITITAEQNEGYTFIGWYDDLNEFVSDDPEYTFKINSNLVLTAKWTYYTITTTPCYNSSNDVPDSTDYYNIAGMFTILTDEKVTAGDEVTLIAVPKEESVTFKGWYIVDGDNLTLLSENLSCTYTMPNENVTIRAKFLLYKYVEGYNNIIEYGFYPQSLLTEDPDTKAQLDNIIGENLPTEDNNNGWTNYNYYNDGTIDNYMWYMDIDLDNDKQKDYRAVYFTKYRANKTTYNNTAGNSNIDDNGYELNSVYYFKFEPVLWDVLETTEYGDTIIMSRYIIDTQNWYIDTANRIEGLDTIYPTNYERSSIKTWLNNDFYNTVFDLYRHKNNSLNLTDNSVQSTGKSKNDYALDGIFADKVYLMSVAEFNKYIKNTSLAKATGTDYAKIQGLSVTADGTYKGYSHYWTRSPQNSNINVTVISNQGNTSYTSITSVYGIRPLMDMYL